MRSFTVVVIDPLGQPAGDVAGFTASPPAPDLSAERSERVSGCDERPPRANRAFARNSAAPSARAAAATEQLPTGGARQNQQRYAQREERHQSSHRNHEGGWFDRALGSVGAAAGALLRRRRCR